MWLLVKRDEIFFNTDLFELKCKGGDSYYKLQVDIVSCMWK